MVTGSLVNWCVVGSGQAYTLSGTRPTSIPLIICRVIMIAFFHFNCPSTDWSIQLRIRDDPHALDASLLFLLLQGPSYDDLEIAT